MTSREEQVDRLIHDAERAYFGQQFAEQMGDRKSASELCHKWCALGRQAKELDPKYECEAWKEGDPEVTRRIKMLERPPIDPPRPAQPMFA